MNAIFVLLPLALLIAGIAVALFVWAVRSGQYDDLDTPAVRVLFDDAPPAGPRREDAGTSAGPRHEEAETSAAADEAAPMRSQT